MKKFILAVNVFLVSIVLFGCLPKSSSVNVGKEKEEIVKEKYGDVEYVFEKILIYKNLATMFGLVKDLDYIVDNSGDRGSVSKELAENFYLYVDVVIHEDEYKILFYNNLMKKDADKTKMFVLDKYILPIKIENIIYLLNEHNVEQNLKDFSVAVVRKDLMVTNNVGNNDPITTAFYNKQYEGFTFMSLYDKNTGNVIVGTENYLRFGNVKQKEIYYPASLIYAEFVEANYNTLNDERVMFSLDGGETFKGVDDTYAPFDIWGEAKNSEVNIVFFSAYTFAEFVSEVDKIRDYEYIYDYELNDEYFDNLIALYDEDYFLNNMLMFYYRGEGNISPNFVHSLTKNGSVLTLNLHRIEGMATALSQWYDVITVRKEDIIEIDQIDIILRTVSELQSYVVGYVEEEYVRDFYLNPRTKEDFKDLENLKDISIFYGSLNVDLIFNKSITDDDLNRVLNYLDTNPNVKSTGYKQKDFIRVQLNHNFYDKVANKTLKISDFIDNQELIEEFSLTISILNVWNLISITFYLDVKGKDAAIKMKKDLLKINYPFLRDGDWIYFE